MRKFFRGWVSEDVFFDEEGQILEKVLFIDAFIVEGFHVLDYFLFTFIDFEFRVFIQQIGMVSDIEMMRLSKIKVMMGLVSISS